MNNPEFYAKNNQPQRVIVLDVIRKYLDRFQWRSDTKDSIIDVGSGTGDMFVEVIWPMLGRNFSRLVLSDLQPKMVDFAKAHYQHLENIEFKVLDIGTAEQLSSNLRGQFDQVVSFHCIHLVENQMKAFENIYQLLRSDEGGDCLLNLFARGPYYDGYIKLSTDPKWSKYMGDVEKYTCYWHCVKQPADEARSMLAQCGFTDIQVELTEKSYPFDSVAAVKAMALAISPYVDRMPQELHEEFMDDFVEAVSNIDENCKVADGKFHFKYEQMTIFARKPPCARKLWTFK